jgi:chromosome segregation ATPase
MTSTKRGRTRALAVVVAAIVMASLWSLTLADEGGWNGSDEKMAGSGKSIECRLEDLEKMIGSSRTPVSERIDVLEEGLRELTKAMGGTGWSSVKSNIREAKKTLDELARHRKQQDEDLRELRQVGKKLERVGDDLAKVRRAMDEMDRRLRRLESRS